MEKLAMSLLPLEQPGAAVPIVRWGQGQPWAAWFEVKILIFCAFSISPDSVNGSLQLCLAGKCPVLVPAHLSPPELAVCTESVPPAGAAIAGRMDTMRDRGKPPPLSAQLLQPLLSIDTGLCAEFTENCSSGHSEQKWALDSSIRSAEDEWAWGT